MVHPLTQSGRAQSTSSWLPSYLPQYLSRFCVVYSAKGLTRRCSQPHPAPMRSFRDVSLSSLKPRALPGAVADLVSRQTRTHGNQTRLLIAEANIGPEFSLTSFASRSLAATSRLCRLPGCFPARRVLVNRDFDYNIFATNSRASNGEKSSIFSPVPTKRVGIFNSSAIATTIPPLPLPSSLVTIKPVNPMAL